MLNSYKEKIKYFIKRFVISSTDTGVLKRKRLTRHFLKTAASTLDVGCGNGDFSILAYKKGGTVVGITTVPDEARGCEKYRDALGLDKERLQFKVLNVFNVLDLNQKFDQIICFEVIEHIKDDEKALKMLSEVLKPGGVIHISTPNIDGPTLYGDVLDDEERGGHVRKGYSYEDFDRLLAKTGLVVIAKDSYGGFFTVKSIEMMRKVEIFMNRRFKRGSKVAQFIVFLLTYPLTFLDPLVACEPFALYVTAKKT